MSKEGRDFSIFGDYVVQLGARVLKADEVSPLVDLGERYTEYWLDEPEYAEIDAEEQYDEFFWDMILEREFPLNVAEALNDSTAQQRASMRVVSWFGSTTNYGADDIIEILIQLDVPRNVLDDGNIAQTYISLWETEYGPDYGFQSATCNVKVGNETSASVRSYAGVTRLDDSTNWNGVTFKDIAMDDLERGD